MASQATPAEAGRQLKLNFKPGTYTAAQLSSRQVKKLKFCKFSENVFKVFLTESILPLLDWVLNVSFKG